MHVYVVIKIIRLYVLTTHTQLNCEIAYLIINLQVAFLLPSH